MILPLFDDAPVLEPNAEMANELTRVVDRRIDLVAHSRSHGENLRRAHDVVLELGEAGPPAGQDHRQEIGQAELRRVTILRRVLGGERLPEARHRPRRGPASDLDDVLGAHAVTVSEPQRAVHVRLGDRAARIGLERQLLELPDAAEAREQLVEPLGLDIARERAIEPVLALEYRLGPGEAGLGEERGDDAGMRRPARVQALRPRAVGQILDDPRGLAPADAEGAHQLVLGQAIELARGGGGGEGTGEGGRVVVARVKFAGDGQPDAAHHLDSGHDGGERRAPRRAGRLAHGKARRDRDRPGVHDRVLTRVVEVEPVSQRRVGEHRVGGGDSHRAADHGALRLAAEALGGRARGASEVVAGGGQTASQDVEREETGLVDHRRRQIFELERDDEAGQAPRDGHRHGVPPRTSRSTSRTAEWM